MHLIRQATSSILQTDPTLAGPLLQIAFHDGATREQLSVDLDNSMFVGGPNWSIKKYEVDWNEHTVEVYHARYKQWKTFMQTQKGLSLAYCIALVGAEVVEFAGGPVRQSV